MKNAIRNNLPVVIDLFVFILLVVLLLPESKRQIKTPHFAISFSSSLTAADVFTIGKVLEENYERVGSDLKTRPASNLEVNIYARRWQYCWTTGNWLASGSIEGVAKLHFVQQAWGEKDGKRVAVHEFTHAVVLKLLLDHSAVAADSQKFDARFSTFPVWLWEAVSCYEAGQWVDPKSLSFLSQKSYPSLQELNVRSKGGKIYSVGYTIIEYLIAQYGQEKLVELIVQYGDIQKVLGVSEEEFSKGWYQFLRHKYWLE